MLRCVVRVVVVRGVVYCESDFGGVGCCRVVVVRGVVYCGSDSWGCGVLLEWWWVG